MYRNPTDDPRRDLHLTNTVRRCYTCGRLFYNWTGGPCICAFCRDKSQDVDFEEVEE